MVAVVFAIVAFLIAVLRQRRRKKSQPTIFTAKPAVETESPRSAWWQALAKTRNRFLVGPSRDARELREALEEACLVSDLGVANTQEALDKLDWEILAKSPPEQRAEAARAQLAAVISPWLADSAPADTDQWPVGPNEADKPRVIWFVGVNGVGKTTSIAKLAAELQRRGYKVLLGAGDTFRAAAGEQLETWAQRLGIECVRGQMGADSSAVLFDAIKAGQARGVDFVLCDSAGRLHNQTQLMEALSKNKRVMQKAIPTAPHETLLVLDANTGQNMLTQGDQFFKAVGITGLILTKLDGTARGGAVIALSRQTKLPLRRLGLGEGADDFLPFEPEAFTKALLGEEARQTP